MQSLLQTAQFSAEEAQCSTRKKEEEEERNGTKLNWLPFFSIVAGRTALHMEESNHRMKNIKGTYSAQPAYSIYICEWTWTAERLARLLHPIRFGRFVLSFLV